MLTSSGSFDAGFTGPELSTLLRANAGTIRTYQPKTWGYTAALLRE